jgi:ligand-binding sensor domain-containing protein
MLYDRFETIGKADGLPSDKVTTVLAEAGRDRVVGTDAGLAVRRDGRWTTHAKADGLGHDYVTSVARDPLTGSLWISTLRGLSRLSGGRITTWTQLDSGLLNDVVYHVLVDGPLVVAATGAGTSILDTRTGTWSLHDHTNSIMHEPWCYALATGPGRLWVGVWGGGVVELDRETQRWREYRDPDGEMEIDLLRDDGPIHDVTSFVAYDAGLLWQGTYFGLSRYDGRRWRTYLARDAGLPGDFINHVSARGKVVFVATDQGLGVFDGTTCVTHRRAEDGGGDVVVVTAGQEVERRRFATGLADDYVLWAHGGESEVWAATGRGLSHGWVADDRPASSEP